MSLIIQGCSSCLALDALRAGIIPTIILILDLPETSEGKFATQSSRIWDRGQGNNSISMKMR